ncbi:MAG TPA: GNAT family N-acetyltransferase, partial [Polyangiaceae bacterium]|nr:GNAT family N-acetyltransferase [Polyangiaceae bacterium]
SVEGEHGPLFALRTPPFAMTMALGSTEAAHELGRARALAEEKGEVPPLPGVVAPTALARAFAEGFADASGRLGDVKTRLRLYDLERVEPPKRLPRGSFRAAEARDVESLVAFYAAFVEELGGPSVGVRSTVERGVLGGRMYVWEVDGEPVSMAQRGGDTPNSTRLNLVFTERASRGKGYAAACVAAVSQAVFDSGKRFACLNADLANATSNALYLRLGYRPVCDLDEWDLSM